MSNPSARVANPFSRGSILRARSGRTPLLALVATCAAALACQSGNDLAPDTAASGLPAAAFSQDRTSGAPGLEVQFSDASTGDITQHAWRFGSAGSSSERNPRVRFDDPGHYTVELTVSGPSGESTATKSALIEIAEVPEAAFDCPPRVFALMPVLCSDASVGAESVAWDFGDGGRSSDRSPTHVFDLSGRFTVTQTARSAGGEDTATAEIEVLPLSFTADPATGAVAPTDVTFRASTGGVPGLAIWMIDGAVVGDGRTFEYTFRAPGTYRVELVFGEVGTGAVGVRTLDYVVGYGPAVADFAVSPAEGTGPLTVAFEDRTTGAVTRRTWDFGDGSRCTFPAATTPGGPPTCSSASPTHVYSEVDVYDVELSVVGPGATPGSPDVVSTLPRPGAVRVLMLDAGFEAQAANGAIGGAWTSLRPADATTSASHTALSRSAGGSDGSMPTEGGKWAVLDGLGTTGSTPVAAIENGIAQEFLRPAVNTVLELDYALLFAEPPAGAVMDAFTATVTEIASGTTLEIPSARVDVSDAYQGGSARFPTRDGATVRATPVATAAIDLATAFPGALPGDRFLLTLRVTNAVNGFRSPRAYVDAVRFVAPAALPQIAQFSLAANPVVAGQDVVFTDESCPTPGPGCELPTSWRWDFGTSRLPTPPASSGARVQSPTYRFPTAGTYEVRLRVGRADQASEVSLPVTVIGGPSAAFAPLDPGPYSAPATIGFENQSTSDPADPIVAWSWDFCGFGTSTLADPGPVVIGQAGDCVVRLQIETASGLTSETERTLVIE